MADDSTQKWLGRNRPPRVQITYDLETGGAIQKKELPLVVGILADLAGDTKDAEPLAALKKRKFVEIDRDNFNDVLKSIGPTLTIKGKALEFKKIDDFRPESIVTQVEDLKQLLDTRQALNDLLAKLDGNDSLNAQLRRVVESPENQTKLLEVVKVTEEKKEAEGGN
ncbi:MAG TPA: type VI secretion system contractile sheath small subunit [Thermoanaerobaculia bacterium]|nr:type VI secretion system contractile sheath small subunit [Thermoanaerobaculia bacterium]